MKKYLVAIFIFLFSVPAYADFDAIDDVFVVISSDYINEKSPKDIMVKGLNVLSSIDKAVYLKYTNDKIFFYYGPKMVKQFEMPVNTLSPEDWADFTKSIIATAIGVSDKIELIDFEIPDRFAKEVFTGLDGYSHYYSAYSDLADTPKVAKRNFASRIVSDNILLIKILAFRKDVSQKVKQEIDDCSQCKALILDLRGNHGGLLDEAIKITDMFLDEGIITYTLSKDGTLPKFYTSTSGDIFSNKPIVILVDGFSASASEVLASALSEQNRAVLIGTQTYGKGTVQNVSKNASSSAMAITTSYFYTPGGNKIDKLGLMPAVCTGGLKLRQYVTDGVCDRQDRFTNEADVEIAVKFIEGNL
ncbi:MAG: hypothetical protein E7016_04320 [Alphaproteobacteria bacterium]|nr:hypothetical protein [Alphaproteobacteria bacterium]